MIVTLWRRLPRLVRFMLAHAGMGIAVGWGLLLAMLRLNVMGLGGLIERSPDGTLATAMLAAFFAITFGSVGIGIAVINLPWREE
ncbi:MAG TPA: hypothetical protein VFR34_08925 [Paracoccaceae bacterium]|nr:hypothetical protein [Paracoccaceae bacterium]